MKAITGATPGQSLRRELIMKAKRLFANTDLTISEIGYRLNFDDASYFGRFFRREAGASPTAFRKGIRPQYQISNNQSLHKRV